MKSNLNSDNIQVFPTQNSRDNGKLLLEENLYNTVWRITKLNYVYEEPEGNAIVGNGTYNGIAIYAKNNKEIKFNIHGYDVHTTSLFFYFADESAPANILNDPNYTIVTSSDYGEDIPFGLVLSRMATSPYRLKGDKLVNSRYVYYGVDFMAGGEFNSAPDEWKLQLGTVTLTKSEGSSTVNIPYFNIKYNTLIIDGDTIMIKEGDEYYPLPDYLKGNYVAKSGNNYRDGEYSGGVIHDSDIYGSLMFRDSKDSEDYKITVGFNKIMNLIELNNQAEGVAGVQLSSSNVTGVPYNNLYLGEFCMTNIPECDFTDNWDCLTLYHADVRDENIEDKKNYFKIGVDTTIIEPSSNSVGDPYNNDPDKIKFHTLFDKEKVEVKFNDNSLVSVRCDKDVSRISFGEYETTPIFLDYDTKNHDLSVNDKLGAIGVVKFCDGQCVDESEYYSTHDHSKDRKYDYTNDYIPKSYSEQKNESTNGFQGDYLDFADISQSHYENVHLDDRFLSLQFDTLKYNNSRDNYYIYTANRQDNDTIIELKEQLYGFYISRDWETDKHFKPSAGAFDFNVDEEGKPISVTEKSGYEYVDLPISVSSHSVSETRKSYDYVTRRFKIPKSLYGKQILILEGYSIFDVFNYVETAEGYPFDESYNGILDRTKLNAYFCTDRIEEDSIDSEVKFGYSTEYPTIDDDPIKYTLVETTKQNGNRTTILNFEDLSGENCIVNVPDISERNSGDLYFIITLSVSSAIGASSSLSEIDNDNGNNKSILIYNKNSFREPDPSISGGNWGIRGFDGTNGFTIGINPKKYIVNKDHILEDNFVSKFLDASNSALIDYIPQTGLNSIIYSYACRFNYTYTTSKTYKSYRIHGYYDAVRIGERGVKIESIPPESEVGYGDEYTYKYNCYRFIYELGFEDSDIKIEKLTNMIFDGQEVPVLYKLSRKDGKNIKFTACTCYWFQGPNTYPYPGASKYFYVDNLKKPSVFTVSNSDFKSGDEIKTVTDSEIANNMISNYTSSTFYNRTTGNLGKYALKDYTSGVDTPVGDSIWFIRNFTVIHGAGINFNVGQNRFNVNVDSYFNETSHMVKAMFGDNDELSTTITPEQARFTYSQDNPSGGKPIYKSITLNKEGLTFEGDPDDITDSDITVTKVRDQATEEITNPFNGLEINGDLRANRVFNAVYNDYADNLKCSKVSEYEPGDIICKEPGTDEYVISSYDLRRLVVGVYSDTYGHLLGGDENKSISENSKNYVPVALAGNVRVKVIGFAKAGDLIEVSNVPGVGRVAKNPQIGTIIGKLLEDKDNYEVERVLMQVMLL